MHIQHCITSGVTDHLIGFFFFKFCADGIDGKQARRTHTSGPVGELFDHGLDSWTTIFIPTLLYSIFGRSPPSIPPYRMFYICWHVFINFYLSHWEKYNTGVLFLPWSYDISMLVSNAIFFLMIFWRRTSCNLSWYICMTRGSTTQSPRIVHRLMITTSLIFFYIIVVIFINTRKDLLVLRMNSYFFSFFKKSKSTSFGISPLKPCYRIEIIYDRYFSCSKYVKM